MGRVYGFSVQDSGDSGLPAGTHVGGSCGFQDFGISDSGPVLFQGLGFRAI